MKWVGKIIMGLAMLSQVGAYAAPFRGQDGLSLQDRVVLEQQEPLSGMTEAVLRLIPDRHVVFISGILNNFAVVPGIANYYSSLMREVEELGAQTTYIGPPSWRSFMDNGERLARRFRELNHRVGKPLVLICHSKGAAEALYALMMIDPSLMDQEDGPPVVDRVVLIQAAIGGSPLASPEGRNKRLKLVSWYLRDGLDSLEPTRSDAAFRDAYLNLDRYLTERFGDMGRAQVEVKRQEFFDRIFYLRGYQESDQLSFGLKVVLWFCGRTLGLPSSDGLIYVGGQSLDPAKLGLKSRKFRLKRGHLGIDLGVIRLDHLEGAISGVLSNSGDRYQEALIRALLQQVYEVKS